MTEPQVRIRRPDRLLRMSEVLSICGLSKTSVYALMAAGQFPQRVYVGPMARWSWKEVQQWVRERIEARDAERRSA